MTGYSIQYPRSNGASFSTGHILPPQPHHHLYSGAQTRWSCPAPHSTSSPEERNTARSSLQIDKSQSNCKFGWYTASSPETGSTTGLAFPQVLPGFSGAAIVAPSARAPPGALLDAGWEQDSVVTSMVRGETSEARFWVRDQASEVWLIHIVLSVSAGVRRIWRVRGLGGGEKMWVKVSLRGQGSAALAARG